MNNTLNLMYHINTYVYINKTTLKELIYHIYQCLIRQHLDDLPINVYVQVDNNEPNDLDEIRVNDYYVNYMVTGCYVNNNGELIIYAISPDDYKQLA